MPDPSILYANDEQIFTRDPANFADLLPPDQVVAMGADGSVSGWTLTSPSASFIAAGVSPGMVVILTEPSTVYGASGAKFGIASCTATTLTLRQAGFTGGIAGQPPLPSTGASFAIRTFLPQIEDASYRMNQHFGIDDNLYDRRAAFLYDNREIREATVLLVLSRIYASENRTAAGDWSAKLAMVKTDLAELMDKLDVQWGSYGVAEARTNRFSAQYRR